MNDALDLSSSW